MIRQYHSLIVAVFRKTPRLKRNHPNKETANTSKINKKSFEKRAVKSKGKTSSNESTKDAKIYLKSIKNKVKLRKCDQKDQN